MARARRGAGATRKKRRRKAKKGAGEGFLARLGALAQGILGGGESGASKAHAQEIKGFLLIGLSLWLCVSMLSYYKPFDDPRAAGRNWGGQVGFYLANAAFISTGLAGHLFGLLGICWGFVLLARKRIRWASLRIVGALCFVLSIAFLLEMSMREELAIDGRLPYGPGGWFALQATPLMQAKVGVPGLWILMALLGLVSFMLATEMAFMPALGAFRDWVDERREERGESFGRALWGWTRGLFLGLWDFLRGARLGESAEAGRGTAEQAGDAEEAGEEEYEEEEEEYEAEEEEPEEDLDEDEEYEEEEEEEQEKPAVVRPPAASRAKARAAMPKAITPELPFRPPVPPKGDWKLPPIDLLEPPERGAGLDDKAIEAAALKLEQALASFRVEASVVDAQIGPTVILFELEVSQGTRMNKVTQLSQEIAAALRAQSVRIIAPIPGKATIGIEVPNAMRRKVRISELISKNAYDKKFAALPLFLGMDAEGHAIVEDLARMPHVLIAGTTGSGKSVCINTILASFLLTRSPHDVQMILIDPKMVELQMFANIPHLMLPVVTDMRHATNVLLWATEKMEGRYELFKDANVRNIKSFNALGEDELRKRLGDDFSEERTPRHLPYIVVVIDEFADLMMASKKEAEQAITRLAQKSRAVGIHVVLATQRPSTDVITGVIKGNLPTRVAFQVASKVDSRVILDSMGAEKLLGGGDMLYTPPQSSRVIRVQGALVEDHELQNLIDFVCQESAPSFSQELIQAATGTVQPDAGGGLETALQDDLWDDAVRVILKSKRGSASLLQRALGIGYTRASRLLDMMGEAGIVSEHKGSKAREVLLSLAEWEEQHAGSLEGSGGERGNHDE
jgi:S-DNA-T family DNA segregation ATPase FtsK/SpoIIIE